MRAARTTRVITTMAMPTSPLSFSIQARTMKSPWKSGFRAQARRLTGLAPGAAGVRGGCGDAVAAGDPDPTGTTPGVA